MRKRPGKPDEVLSEGILTRDFRRDSSRGSADPFTQRDSIPKTPPGAQTKTHMVEREYTLTCVDVSDGAGDFDFNTTPGDQETCKAAAGAL